MTLEEFYAQVDGSYADALAYLRSERLVSRLVVKFLNDGSLPRLFSAWEAGDERASFEAAHEAKGVCANLYLTALATRASDVTEALRPGAEARPSAEETAALVADLHAAYDQTIEALRAYAAQA